MGRASNAKKLKAVEPILKLDFGCGLFPKEGFEGVDILPFDGKVKHVCDLKKPWPWKESSVSEGYCSHYVEHLTSIERIHFFNELWRVLKPDATCLIVVPHWASTRAYGDPTHQWPPFSEFAFYYLNRDWRAANAPHTDVKHWPQGFKCHFAEPTYNWHFNPDPYFLTRNDEYKRYAASYFKDVIADLSGTLTAKKEPVT